MKTCVQRGRALVGKQQKFCSRQCKNRCNNNVLQSYEAQQLRGRRRKVQLIRHKGARCEMCGYRKNFAALEFHHNDPGTKLFQLDLRSLSNRKWSAVLEEAGKCRLLCSNCHAELHNPDCRL
jgi:hypothetical protein